MLFIWDLSVHVADTNLLTEGKLGGITNIRS